MAQNRIPPRRGSYVPVKQTSFHEADTIQDEDDYDGYDDALSSRLPTSARRYQYAADVQTGDGYERSTGRSGRTRPDVQTLSSQSSQSSWRNRDEGNEGVEYQPKVPLRRRATQTGLPAVQPRRRPVQTDDVDVSNVTIPHTEALHRNGQKRRLHWMVFLGGAMLIMVLGWVVLSSFANWWQVTQDDWHYGRPRTYQVDAVVGQNDSSSNPSHFIALNLNSHIEIIEFPGGDATKAKVFIGPTLIGPGQDLAPATLDFRDVNGDGKVDMIVNVGGSHFVFINDNGSFRPARTTDNIHL
ncbi:MAG TPA: hypothetical protein VKU38_08945 [Ktedonobacteraceae bacterium]|nr:hypothetical protein [Ktedonobacteraceae bacterium]